MRPEDRIRLQHMLDAAEDALRFASGLTRADLDTNRMATFAIVRAVEIIGEAAATVSDETKRGYADLPWGSMIAMRHRLIHAYYDIDLNQVWDTITEDLPPLIARLQEILADARPDSR